MPALIYIIQMYHVGGGSFVEGVELSLPGCREKDTVEVYMTYNMAYGDALINFIL